MLNLIKNEYVKIFSKISTYILLIILVLAGFLFQSLPKLSDFLYDDYYYYGYNEDPVEFYRSQKAWMEEDYKAGYMEENDYKIQMAEIDFCMKNNLPVKYYYGNEWQGTAINNTFYTLYSEILYDSNLSDVDQTRIETAMENCKKAVIDDNWKLYYQTMFDYYNSVSSLTNTEKENQVYRYQYYLNLDREPEEDAWDYYLIDTYQYAKSQLESYDKILEEGGSVDEEAYDKVKNTYLVSKYRLDNQIEYAVYYDSDMHDEVIDSNYFTSLNLSVSMISIISIIMIVIAGGIIAKEFSQGTIKFYLINPISRARLFWSKYLTVFSFALILTIASFVFQSFLGIIFNGFSELGTQYLYANGDSVGTYSAFLFVLKNFGFNFIGMVTTMTLAFMISSLLRSSSLAIGISIAVQFAGSTVTSLMAVFGLDFGRYLLFANTDLDSITNPNYSLFPNHTLSFALCVLAVYMVVFLLTAYDGFTRREV